MSDDQDTFTLDEIGTPIAAAKPKKSKQAKLPDQDTYTAEEIGAPIKKTTTFYPQPAAPAQPAQPVDNRPAYQRGFSEANQRFEDRMDRAGNSPIHQLGATAAYPFDIAGSIAGDAFKGQPDLNKPAPTPARDIPFGQRNFGQHVGASISDMGDLIGKAYGAVSGLINKGVSKLPQPVQQGIQDYGEDVLDIGSLMPLERVPGMLGKGAGTVAKEALKSQQAVKSYGKAQSRQMLKNPPNPYRDMTPHDAIIPDVDAEAAAPTDKPQQMAKAKNMKQVIRASAPSAKPGAMNPDVSPAEANFLSQPEPKGSTPMPEVLRRAQFAKDHSYEGAMSPLDIAAAEKGAEAQDKVSVIKQQVGKLKGDLTDKADDYLIATNQFADATPILEKFKQNVRDRFGAVITPSGSIVDAAGQAMVDSEDKGMIAKMWQALNKLGPNTTLKQLDGVTSDLRNMVQHKKVSETKQLYTTSEGIGEAARGDIQKLTDDYLGNAVNWGGADEFLGPDGAAKLKQARHDYAKISTIEDHLNRGLGEVVDEASGQRKMGSSLFKSSVKSNSDRGTKSLFDAVKQLTGVDLMHEAGKATIAMQAVGDPRITDLLEKFGDLHTSVEAMSGKPGAIAKVVKGATEKVTGNKAEQILRVYNKNKAMFDEQARRSVKGAEKSAAAARVTSIADMGKDTDEEPPADPNAPKIALNSAGPGPGNVAAQVGGAAAGGYTGYSASEGQDPNTRAGMTIAGMLGGAAVGRAAMAKGRNPNTMGMFAGEHATPPELQGGLYSNAEKAIRDVNMPKAPASQWLAMLDPAKGSGVKADELKFTGLSDMLKKKGNAPVTKQELLDHMDLNKVELKDVTKNDVGFDRKAAQKELEQKVADDVANDQEYWYEDIKNNKKATLNNIKNTEKEDGLIKDRYGDMVPAVSYEHDGKKILFDKDDVSDDDILKEFGIDDDYAMDMIPEVDIKSAQKEAIRNADFYSELDQMETYYNLESKNEGANNTKFGQYQLPGGKNYRETLVTLPSNESERKRLTSIVGSTKDPAERETAMSRLREIDKPEYKSSHWDEPNVVAHYRQNDREIDGKKTLFVEEIQSDWHQEGRKKGYTNEDKEMRPGSMQGVPQAPFSKNWHELAFKKILKEAEDKGYQQVAWTTGEQQAARYDLSKQIDELHYQKNSDGTFKVSYQAGGRGNMIGDKIPPEKLEDYIGKDVAKKIVDGDGKSKNFAGNNESKNEWQSLSGVDLKVGGEGMKGFYDKMLVDFANKYGKKFGAKVQTKEVFTKNEMGTGVYLPVHTMEITPQMKQYIKSGQPMFAIPATVAGGAAAYNTFAGKKKSTSIAEMAN